MNKLILTLAILAILGATSAKAGYATGLIVSYAEAPGSMTTSVQDLCVQLNYETKFFDNWLTH